MNAGDLGSIMTVCACAYDLTDVTAQGQSHGSTAHAYPLHTRVKILCLFYSLWGHVNFMTIYGH